MKVIIIGATPPPAGGIAVWTTRMLKAKLKNNWSIILVDKKLIGKREVFGDKIKRNFLDEIQRCFRIWKDLLTHLKEKETVVVHSCIPAYTLSMMQEYVGALLTKVRRRKYIMHFRCTVPDCVSGKLGHFMLKRICNISDCIIVLNSRSMEYVKKYAQTPVVCIPNFVETDEIAEEKRINEIVKRALYVGGVTETKGCADILEIAKQYPDITFRLVGNAESKIIKLAEGLNNVVFVGQLSHAQVREELKQADVFLFLSYFSGEGFSNALAEAMAAGLPCIVTDWAANADMIGDGGGYVVPIKSPNAAVEAFGKMLPKDKREQMSQYNINKIKRDYAQSVIIDKYVDVYEEVTKEM